MIIKLNIKRGNEKASLTVKGDCTSDIVILLEKALNIVKAS